MSVTLYYEPYKFPAGILALAVHCAFFALLYFGFTWQMQPAATMSVELWQSLPDTTPAVQPQSKPKPKPQPKVEDVVRPAQPQEVVKPDIALPDKKKIEPKPVAVKPEPVKQAAAKTDTSIEDQAMREQAAATGRMVDEYTAKIQTRIRRNIVMPPGVADDARAEFSVTLLPGGTVLSARLTKSSGNAVYDNAVERAILKSQPLPLPADVAMFNKFRELKLGFRPVE